MSNDYPYNAHLWDYISSLYEYNKIPENNLQLKIKRLHKDAKIPIHAKFGDAGLDLTAISLVYNQRHNFYEFGTGLAFEIPEGHVGLIFPRSSISNKDMYLTNAVGVVDSGYRGEVKFRFKMNQSLGNHYKIGDKVGQMIVMPFPKVEVIEVEELAPTARGIDGFGSSGK